LGAGFTGTQRVLFGSAQATSFQIVSDNLIYATVGAGASGAVTVITAQNTLSLNGFIYGTPPLPPPTISNVAPSTVFPGDTLFVSGQLLEQVRNVSIGGQPMNFTLVNGQIRVIVGAVPSGQQTLLIGSASGTSAFSISVLELPEARLFRLSSSILQAGEQSVTINAEGINLSRMQTVSIFEGTTATASAMVLRSGISFPANSAFSFIFPPNIQTAGIKTLQFLNANGAIISATLMVVAAPAPNFALSVVSTTANSRVFTLRLHGSGFMRSATILLNGNIPLRSFVESPTSIVLDIPRELNIFAGEHRIRLVNTDRQSTEAIVRVERGNLPYITNVDVRLSGAEYILTVSGANFDRNIIGLLGLSPVRVLSADSNRVTVSILASKVAFGPTNAVVLYLVNPNNTSIGVWLAKSLFEEARIEAASSMRVSGNVSEGRQSSAHYSTPTFAEVTAILNENTIFNNIANQAQKQQQSRTQNIISVQIFPNPASNLITLVIPPNMIQGNSVVNILDARGETVLSFPLQQGEQRLSESVVNADISVLPSGRYYVQVAASASSAARLTSSFVIVR
jgi:hypothetical protein